MRVSGRSQQMGGRGLTPPAARWLVDGSAPARSERRVAAVFIVAFAALLALALLAQGQTDVCSQTPEVRDAILAETGAAACSSVTSTQLASITRLEIKGYSSANIVPADFAGLTTLDVLAISRSPALTTVPANAFSEVTSLTALVLTNNSISSVHADASNGLSALGSLVLFNNYIKVLEDGIFAGMDALYEIFMEHNLVSVLDEDTFAGAPNLSTISLAFNRVSSVHADAFAGRTDTLTDLSLQGNRISSLPAGIFDDLTALTTLNLRDNELTALDPMLFTPFASALTFLDIRDNSFATPPTPDALLLTNSGLTFYSDEVGPPDTGLSEISINPGALNAPFVAPGSNDTFATVAGQSHFKLPLPILATSTRHRDCKGVVSA